MQTKISTAQELGLLVRATRKSQKLRMDDAAGSARVGHVFVREVERGKETVQLGRVLRLLAELGIELRADVGEEVVPILTALKLTGLKPLRPRRASTKGSAKAAGSATGQGKG